jgi:hypothetical protein
MNMKTIFVKYSFAVASLLLLSGTFGLQSCKKKDNSVIISAYMTTGNATGDQMKPVVTTTGFGTLSGTYTVATHQWEYLISWNGLSDIATTVQFKGPAAAGADGAMISDLGVTSGGVVGSSSGTVTLTEAQATALVNGLVYYVIGNPTHPGGEIRGQVQAVSR